MRPSTRNEFEIAIICALPLEADAIEALFDETYDKFSQFYGRQFGDKNAYITGRIGRHNLVLCYLPGIGKGSAAGAAANLRVSYTHIQLVLVVGICGGVPFPSNNAVIILGDIIISDSVIEYDFGRQYPDGFRQKSEVKETLGRPNQEIRAFLVGLKGLKTRDELQNRIYKNLQTLQAQSGTRWQYPGVEHDILFKASDRHKHYRPDLVAKCICLDCKSSRDPICDEALKGDCSSLGCIGNSVQRSRLRATAVQPLVHIGTIATANTVMKSGEHRDQLAEKDGVIGFEMEGAGVWDNLPCIIIKGVCDYADSHKNKMWQNYAAATAASCTKAFLEYWIGTVQKPQAPERPKPSSTVPFARDRKFVGREDILTAIEKTNQEGTKPFHKRAAVVGLGGVGKSQIAIEYTYRVQESAPNTWLFWIHASNATRFEQGYREIASMAEIPGRDDPKINIFQLVNKWLHNEENGQWLMVLDNVDDNNIFFSAPGRNAPLADYLPQTPNRLILITSRNRLAAQNLVGSYGNVIPVEPMSTDNALTLLQTRINVDKSSENEAKMLVETLECIPLAIIQAGAYIANRTPRITVSTYLELFQQSESNQEHLLKYNDAKDLRRDESIQYPVITTWQISFNQIHHISPVAIDLLALMSMFDRQGIPEGLVKQNMGRLDFEDAVAPLISFSLIWTKIGGQSFEMHRLVQLSMRQWLKWQGEFHKWVKQSRQVIKEAFPSGDYKTWTTCQMLLPHLKEVIQFTVEFDKDDQLNSARIANRYGWYLYLMGNYKEAEAMHRRALAGYEKVLGANHPDTLTSVSNLGLVLESQGKHEEAEAMHRQALAAREKVLGANHLNTLTSVSNLGLVLRCQGKYEEAEAMHRQALAIREKVLGANHPNTLTSVGNLGSVLKHQGKYEEAEAMHRRVLVGYEKVLGANHPDTLTSVNNLGLVLESQGKHEEAEAMHRQALAGYERVLGANHPSTLNSVSNLGLVLGSQGRYEEAEAMHRRALTARENVLGANHPNTLTSVSNLGLVLESQGKYEEAEAMHRQALAGYERVLGANHPSTLNSVSNLGSVLESQGKYEEAEAMHRRDLQGSEKVLGSDHPNTLIGMWNLSHTLKKRGQDVEALELLQSCIRFQRQKLGPNHPHTIFATAMLNNWQSRSRDLPIVPQNAR